MWDGTWFKPWTTDVLQKRLAKYLLRQTVGKLLGSQADWDSFDFELVNGQASLRNLAIDTEVINGLLARSKGPSIRTTGGRIGTLRIVVPWNGLFTDPCAMELEDVVIDLAVQDTGNSDIELSDDDSDPAAGSVYLDAVGTNGLTDLARMIENILGKVTLSLSRIKLRLAMPSGSSIEVSLQQLSLCDHTSELIQRLIPTWLWMSDTPLLHNIVKYLRPIPADMTLVTSMNKLANGALPMIDVDHLRLDLHGINVRLQQHIGSAGEAASVDITVDGFQLQHRLPALVDIDTSVILKVLALRDILDQNQLHDFLENKNAPPKHTPSFSRALDDALQIRVEKFTKRQKTEQDSNAVRQS
eukprot:jgi/Hompol1/5111/HPOL_004156-RA